MGEVVRFLEFHKPSMEQRSELSQGGLVPLQFGVGFDEVDLCLEKLAEYGIRDVYLRELAEPAGTPLMLITVGDALWLNTQILQREKLSNEVTRRRIDLLQMLENVDPWLMQSIWESFSRDVTPDS